MDSNITRLKTKIGDHEFEAEGSAEYVREQFQAWQELLKMAIGPSGIAPRAANEISSVAEVKNDVPNVDAELTKIIRLNGRYVSLTARTPNIQDAVLIMLYGQKLLRNNDSVTGVELLSGLSATGFGKPRLDRILDKLAEDGDVISFGERRGKKYRLTNTGIAKARVLANDLIVTVA